MAKKRKSAVPDRAPSSAKRIQSESHPRTASRRVSSVATSAHRDEPSTPAPTATPTPTPILDEPSESPLILPTKIANDAPLPTVKDSQLSLLPPSASAAEDDYQSYSQSGVLEAALQRSRMRWLQDPPFEKYWTKSSKKKNQPQPTSKNPPRDSMIKLGSCSFVIGPHHLHAMLYTVRGDPLPKTFSQRPPYTPPQRSSSANLTVSTPESVEHRPRPVLAPSIVSQQDPRHTPSTPSILPSQPHIAPSPTPFQASPVQPSPQPQSQVQQQVRSESLGETKRPPLSVQSNTQLSQAQQPPQPPASQIQPQPQSRPPSPAQAQAQPSPQPQQPAPRTSQDPVIQMLATRAASDSELKALMQIVASKKADQVQLRRFQTHIDELNAIINAKNTNAPSSPAVSQSRPSSSQSSSHQPGPSLTRPQATSSVPAVNSNPKPHVHQRLPALASSSAPYHPSPLQQSFVHSPAKSGPKAVVFEFLTAPAHNTHFSHVATGDRYLFPPNTILEYTDDGATVIASFLAIKTVDTNEAFVDLATGKQGAGRGKYNKKQKTDTASNGGYADEKGSNAGVDMKAPSTPSAQTSMANGHGEGSGVDASNSSSSVKEFYQPVTIQLSSPHPRILEPLARVVRPPEDVKKYMDDIMDRLPRAGPAEVHLALRLPKEGSNTAKEMQQLTQAGSAPTLNDINDNKSSRRKSSTGRTKSKTEDGASIRPKAPESREPKTATEPPCEIQEEDDELKSVYDTPSFLMPLG